MTNWSNEQLAIFDFFRSGAGNLVVRARAGTGKTTTIIEAITYAPEAKILLAAFNKRIAEELKTKLRNPKAEAKTLHSLGFAYVRRALGQVRVDDDAGFDRAQRACPGANKGTVALVAKIASLAKNAAPFATAKDIEELAVDYDLLPSDEDEQNGWALPQICRAARKAMDLAAKCEDRRVDFDDMVFIPVVAGIARAWYDLVVIDEAQDMNVAQLLLALKAVRKSGRVVVVGDDRQAIYGFRGADSGSIDRLKGELSAVELPLTTTYRCPKRVVELAAVLVPDYKAADAAPEGVVDQIVQDKLPQTAVPGDFVLSRKNAPLMATCLTFLRAGVPARVEGKDVGRHLASIAKKVGGRTIPEFLGRLVAWGERQKTRAVKSAKTESKKEEAAQRIDDQVETLKVLATDLQGLEQLEARIRDLFQDAQDKPRPAVVCSSVHKAKGLEADRVFILRGTLYPGGRRDDQEERNVEYVAVTRSKRQLTWVDEAGAA